MNEEENNTECKNSNEVDTLLEKEVQKNNGMNNNVIKCKYCLSKILNPQMGTYIKQEFSLPLIKKKSKSDKDEEYPSAVEKHFWEVKTIYTFENMGFSKTVEKVKYLVCADCESGPLGYFDENTKISYLALERVNYVN